MSEAFQCEMCGKHFPLQAREPDLTARVGISTMQLDVEFTVRVAEVSISRTKDVCRPCALQALSKGLTKLLQEGEKKGT